MCWRADLVWFIFYIRYFWLILFFASKSLVSLWLKYCAYDLRKGSSELWGIIQPDRSTKYRVTDSETQYFKHAEFPEAAGCGVVMACFQVPLGLVSCVLTVILRTLLQEVHLLGGRKPSEVVLYGTDTVWPNREVSRQRSGNFFQ